MMKIAPNRLPMMRAEAADDDHGEEVDRQQQVEGFGRHEAGVVRHQCAADAGVERRNPEREDAIIGEVDAHDLGREIVIAHGDHGAAVAGAHEVGREQDT